MPGRDRTGPLGQGARSGRGMGDCLRSPRSQAALPQDTAVDVSRPFHWGARLWDGTVGRLLLRRRAHRMIRGR